ncbi:TMhelix containing protein [Vibrio phage 1.253.O._10N.286.45.B12]|nr:TMhelix containing protein [Vibrio phage 1.235.O._10N.261.52.B2]AUR98573.1 TMhelix containing protein [Vibrio phage 1.253.O._10N.286.45.B12]
MITKIVTWFRDNSQTLGYIIAAIITMCVSFAMLAGCVAGMLIKKELFSELADTWEERTLYSHEQIINKIQTLLPDSVRSNINQEFEFA